MAASETPDALALREQGLLLASEVVEIDVRLKGLKERIVLSEEIPPQSYGTSPAVRAHTVLPVS